jgi:hypothetical protein
MDISQLRPYSGLHSSLISFSSGHLFRISHWTATPTEFGAFSNLWMVTPQDRRVLFSDPAESERVLRIYHRFDEFSGAKISVERPAPLRLDLLMEADDATRVELHLRLERSLVTRFLVAVSRATPLGWKSSDPSIWLLDRLVSVFIARGEFKCASKTETGQPAFSADVDDLLLVKESHATVNGASLGNLSPPTRPVAFGDFATTPQASLAIGRLYLPYPAAGSPDSGA